MPMPSRYNTRLSQSCIFSNNGNLQEYAYGIWIYEVEEDKYKNKVWYYSNYTYDSRTWGTSEGYAWFMLNASFDK